MSVILLEVPDELMSELSPHREHLVELLCLGLAEWQKLHADQNSADIEQVLNVLAAEGKLIRPTPATTKKNRARPAPVTVTGTPVSEIVIQQRNLP